MKHAHMIPLVGGSAIGATRALGRPPEYIASWPAFAKNDAYCKQYFPDVPFYLLDRHLKLPKVDIVTCVPPCSGLSTATPSTARGCQAPQNEHMLIVAAQAMERGTYAILIENAPTLYSPGGEEFVLRFKPLCKKYNYVMQLIKTSTILHGLPQNRVRSFVILWRGVKIPEFAWIKKPYKSLYDWPVDKKPNFSSNWNPNDDEMYNILHTKLGFHLPLDHMITEQYGDGPISTWKVFLDAKIKYRFKTKPYKYMQQTHETGAGIMDRAPIFVSDHTNALMWKSAHRMLNPATDFNRQFSIRELMSMMGLPKDFKEIPQKDINVLFQNVPVNTVETMVDEIVAALAGDRKWYRPDSWVTRLNNIKQTIEVW